MTSKYIYLDCDEVLLDTARTLADFIHQKFGTVVDKSKYPSDWNLEGFPLDNYQNAMADFVKTEGFANIPVMPGAKEGVMALKAAGYNLSVVTSISGDPNAHQKRERNLKGVFGDVFDQITCLPMQIDNKGKYYHQAPKGTVIDDALYNLLTAQKHGHQIVLMATEQNPHMQQVAQAQKIAIQSSLTRIPQFLRERQR